MNDLSTLSDGRSLLGALGRIILVDDNDADTEFTSIMLRRAGFAGLVETYENGHEVLAALGGACAGVDLLLLDINMPGMNGFEVARALGALSVETPPVVVLVTSSPDPRELDRAAQVPVIRALALKPLSVDDIHHLVTVLLAPGAAQSTGRTDEAGRQDQEGGGDGPVASVRGTVFLLRR